MTRIRVKYPDDVTEKIEEIDQLISDRIGLLTSTLPAGDTLIQVDRMVVDDPIIKELSSSKVRTIATQTPRYIVEE